MQSAEAKSNRKPRGFEKTGRNKPRNGTAEALSIPNGDGGSPLAVKPKKKVYPRVIDADLPALHTHGTSIRDRVAQWVALRVEKPDISYQEAAERIGIGRNTLQAYVSRAAKEGWLKFDDSLARVKYEVVPKALDNLTELLDCKDKTATIETVKNTIFKTYQVAEGAQEVPQTMLGIKIEMVDAGQPKAIAGVIVGRPRELTE